MLHLLVSRIRIRIKIKRIRNTAFFLGALDVLNGTLGKKLENSASYHLHAINKRVDIEERLNNHTEVARYYCASWVSYSDELKKLFNNTRH